MELKELLLLLSANGAFALSIPEVERRSSLLEQTNSSANAEIVSLKTVNSTNVNSANLSSSLSGNNFKTAINLCDYGILDCTYDDSDYESDGSTGGGNTTTKRSLQKRGARDLKWHGKTFKAMNYPPPFVTYVGDREVLPKMVMVFKSNDIRNSEIINDPSKAASWDNLIYEHIPELHQELTDMLDKIAGSNPSAAEQNDVEKNLNAVVDKDELRKLNLPFGEALLKNLGDKDLKFIDLVMYTFGADMNPSVNVLADPEMNSIKEHVSNKKELVADFLKNVQAHIDGKVPSDVVLSSTRLIKGVVNYENHPDVSIRGKVASLDRLSVWSNYKTLTKQTWKVGTVTKTDAQLGEMQKEVLKADGPARTKVINDWAEENLKKASAMYEQASKDVKPPSAADKKKVASLEKAVKDAQAKYEAASKTYDEKAAEIEKIVTGVNKEEGSANQIDNARKELAKEVTGENWQKASNAYNQAKKDLAQARNDYYSAEEGLRRAQGGSENDRKTEFNEIKGNLDEDHDFLTKAKLPSWTDVKLTTDEQQSWQKLQEGNADFVEKVGAKRPAISRGTSLEMPATKKAQTGGGASTNCKRALMDPNATELEKRDACILNPGEKGPTPESADPHEATPGRVGEPTTGEPTTGEPTTGEPPATHEGGTPAGLPHGAKM